MRILTRKAQKQAAVNLALLQHRVMEALPVFCASQDDDTCAMFFDSAMDSIQALAQLIDPDIGLEALYGAFEHSNKIILNNIKPKEATHE